MTDQQERPRIYGPRPINSYEGPGAVVGAAFIDFVAEQFPDYDVVDPKSDIIQGIVGQLIKAHSIDPVTGESSQRYYNQEGGKHIMSFFTEQVVGPCDAGAAGLALPVAIDGGSEFVVGAGVATEMAKMFQLGRPIWVVTCSLSDGKKQFSIHQVENIVPDAEHSTESFV